MIEAKLRWQCRRGMRELDELLVNYLDETFKKSTNSEKQAFRDLLELSDPELVQLLLKSYTSHCESINLIIKKILESRETK